MWQDILKEQLVYFFHCDHFISFLLAGFSTLLCCMVCLLVFVLDLIMSLGKRIVNNYDADLCVVCVIPNIQHDSA